MSGPRAIFTNSIGASSQITISSNLAGFSKQNLLDEYKQSLHRTATSVGTITYTIDLGAATNIRSLLIFNHNYRTSGGTFTLKYGATSPPTHIATLSSVTPSVWISFFATHSARFWTYTARQSNPSGFHSIGELRLAQYREFTFWFDDKWEKSHDSMETVVQTTGGVRWRLPSFERKSLTLTWTEIGDNQDKTYWSEIFASRKKNKPFFIIPNPSLPSGAMFCTIKSMLKFRQQNLDLFSMQVELEEEL